MADDATPSNPPPQGTTIPELISSFAFLGTIAALAVGLPAAGAMILGTMALHASAGALGIAGAGAAGLLGGAVPYATLNHFGKKKNEAYGTIELIASHFAPVDEAIKCIFSPKYGLNKLKNAFGHAAPKPAEAPAPQSAPRVPAAAPTEPKPS